MSFFQGSSGRTRRNLRPKTVHSVSDSDDEPETKMEEHAIPKSTDKEGALSFEDHEIDDECIDKLMIKRPEHSMSLYKKEVSRKKQAREKRHSKTKMECESIDPFTVSKVSMGEIPSAATIHAARKKREMARNVIGGTGNLGRSDQINVASDTENSDDESERVRKFGVSRDTSKQIKVLSAMDAAASGSDEEKFVEEQICKGVFALPTSSLSKNQEENLQDIPKEAVCTTFPIASVPITVESIQSQLNSQLLYLKEHQSHNKDAIEQLEHNIEMAYKEITSMEENAPSLSLQYQFFQEMRCYVKDLLLCLTQKVPLIKSVQESALDIFKGRSELLISRRRQDVVDMMDTLKNNNVNSDESKHARIVEKEGRRRRRQLRRSGEAKSSFEGQSSDDELLPSTEAKYQLDIENVILHVNDIFMDVMDEFSSFASVLLRFREWRYNFPSSYEKAYMPFCLPKLLAPYVSLQYVLWNPLSSDFKLPSFKSLLFFGYNRLDSDFLLVPQLIELVVLPKLAVWITNVWDPLSSSQTSNLVKCILNIYETYSTLTSDSFDVLHQAIVSRCDDCLDKDIFVPIFSPDVMENSSSDHFRFSQIQFWTAFKLLENLTLLQGILCDSHLQRLIIDGLLNRYLLLSLQNSPMSELSLRKVQKVLEVMPSEWLQDSNFLRKHLTGMRRFLTTFASKALHADADLMCHLKEMLAHITPLVE